jgi:hypothetical protein
MNKDDYMTPVSPEDKESAIKALKSLITNIENSNTQFGLMVSYAEVKDVEGQGKDTVIGMQTNNFIVGKHNLIRSTLLRRVKDNKEYRKVIPINLSDIFR